MSADPIAEAETEARRAQARELMDQARAANEEAAWLTAKAARLMAQARAMLEEDN